MKTKLMHCVAVALVSAVATTGAWAANLHIAETPSGVVFSGDGGFTTNDWQSGTASQTQNGLGEASLTAQIYNPGGTFGTVNYNIYDAATGAFSDAFSLTLSVANGDLSIYDLSASFCSVDNSATCSAYSVFVSPLSATEDALGNFTLNVTSLDPNLAAQGTSPEAVPEPASLALVGLGLAGVGFSRRRKKA